MSDSLHIACPHCDTANRFGAAKLADHPNCGKCKQPLFAAVPVELTAENFQRPIQLNESNRSVASGFGKVRRGTGQPCSRAAGSAITGKSPTHPVGFVLRPSRAARPSLCFMRAAGLSHGPVAVSSASPLLLD